MMIEFVRGVRRGPGVFGAEARGIDMRGLNRRSIIVF